MDDLHDVTPTTGPDEAPDAAQAARALAAALTAHADDLADDDLATVASAMTAVRAAAAPLVDALLSRGWPGHSVLARLDDLGTQDDLDDLDDDLDEDLDDEFDEDLEDDDLGGRGDADDEPLTLAHGEDLDLDAELAALLAEESGADDWEVPAGTRMTYQARYDFVVTDPEALLSFVERKVADGDETWDRATILDHGPLHVLLSLTGVGSLDLAGSGLAFAGGQDFVAPVERTLWEMDDDERDAQYPAAP